MSDKSTFIKLLKENILNTADIIVKAKYFLRIKEMNGSYLIILHQNNFNLMKYRMKNQNCITFQYKRNTKSQTQ